MNNPKLQRVLTHRLVEGVLDEIGEGVREQVEFDPPLDEAAAGQMVDLVFTGTTAQMMSLVYMIRLEVCARFHSIREEAPLDRVADVGAGAEPGQRRYRIPGLFPAP